MRWALVCGYGVDTRLLDVTSGETSVPRADLLSGCSFEVRIDGETWSVVEPITSRGGTRILGTVFLNTAGRLRTRIAWRELPDGVPVLLPTYDDCCPLCTADGGRFLFLRTGDDGAGGERRCVMVHDLASGGTKELADQAMQLFPRPLFDRDGRWIHVRERRDADRSVFDIAVRGSDESSGVEVLIADVPEPSGMAMSPDATVLWLVGRDSLRRYDLRRALCTHTWQAADLVGGQTAFQLVCSCLRPDGDALALALWPPADDWHPL